MRSTKQGEASCKAAVVTAYRLDHSRKEADTHTVCGKLCEKNKMKESRRLLTYDGLLDYGEYLCQLNDTEYQFEVEEKGRMVEHTRDEVIASYKAFLASRTPRWKVGILYKDYAGGTMSQTTREFKRTTLTASR